MVKTNQVVVDLGQRSYAIEIGTNLLDSLPTKLADTTKGKQIILLSNEVVYNLYGEKLRVPLENNGYKFLVQIIPDGEGYKTWDMAGIILEEILKARFNRDAIMIALGGGVIGDLAGFIASVYQRGIDFIQVPTTLLSQVDSSVGGKVAVNHLLGKNMIGSFYQPKGVYADLHTLDTLPQREWIAGLAEVIKYGVIWEQEFFNYLEDNLAKIMVKDLEVVQRIVTTSCQIKAQIVTSDEREQGLRGILNFGHTLGHALESVTHYNRYRHGEAVAIGMVLAGKLAVALKMLDQIQLKRLERLLMALGLPTTIPGDIDHQELISHLSFDKKIRDQQLVFILPRSIGQVEITKGVERDLISQVLAQ